MQRIVVQEIDAAGKVVKNAAISWPDFMELFKWLPKLKALLELMQEFEKRLRDIIGGPDEG